MDNFWNDIEQLWHQQDDALRQQGRLMSSEQLKQLIEDKEEQRHSRRRTRLFIAAAACLLLLIGTAFFVSLQTDNGTSPQMYASVLSATTTVPSSADDTLSAAIQTIMKDTIKRLQKSVTAITTHPTQPQLTAKASLPEAEQILRAMDSATTLSRHNIDSVKESSSPNHGIRYLCNHHCSLSDLERQTSTLLAMI